MKGAPPLPAKGDARAADLYTAVGVALSYWEGLEDVLLDCFVSVCGLHEPTAVEAYIAANRQRRTSMMKVACERYGSELETSVAESITRLSRRAQDLAEIRNQIAHGRCEKCHSVVDDVVVLDGHYIMPSKGYPWTGGAPVFRYAHTTTTIYAWVEEVRSVRSDLLDIYFSMISSERYQKLMSDPEKTARRFPPR